MVIKLRRRKRKPRITRREVKTEKIFAKGLGARGEPFLAMRGEFIGEDAPKTIDIGGRRFYLYKRIGLRRNVLKATRKLRQEGFSVRNFQIKRGRLVVDNAVYTRPQK